MKHETKWILDPDAQIISRVGLDPEIYNQIRIWILSSVRIPTYIFRHLKHRNCSIFTFLKSTCKSLGWPEPDIFTSWTPDIWPDSGEVIKFWIIALPDPDQNPISGKCNSIYHKIQISKTPLSHNINFNDGK